LCRSPAASSGTEGFTLIEVLVALSLIAIVFAPLGGLVATSIRGTRSIESHLIRLEAARAVMTALPDRDQLVPGTFSGASTGLPWRLAVLPFATDNQNSPPSARWIPQTIVVTVQSPSGATIDISTVRLQRRDRK
jgi:general secretion pathway protein I